MHARPEAIERPALNGVGGFLFGSGLALSTATQLRLPVVPIGIGESLLLVAMLYSLLTSALMHRFRVSPDGRLVAQIWGVLVLGFLAGWLIGLLSGRWSLASGVRNAAAYAFSLVVIFSFLTMPSVRARIRSTMYVMMVVTACGLALLFALSLATGGMGLSSLEPWVGFRFVGWAENPNQIAIAIGAVPFIAHHFRDTAATPMRRLAATLVLVLGLVIGTATLSDALLVGWLAAASGVVLIQILGDRKSVLFSHTVLLKLALLTLLLLFAGAVFFAAIQSSVVSMMSAEGGQAQVRLALWGHGIEVFLDSPLVGFGPGAYSWIRNPNAIMEAHNTFIDLAASAGITGLLPLLLLIGVATRRAFVARDAGLFGCIVYVIMFSSFHFVLRRPLFWFLIFFVLLTAGEPSSNRLAGP
jgi:O-antigen ligase